jgi:hypothetical protein
MKLRHSLAFILAAMILSSCTIATQDASFTVDKEVIPAIITILDNK